MHCGEYIGYSNRCLVCGEWLDGSSCSVHGDVCQVEYWRKFHNGTWWEVYYPLSNIRRSFNLTEYVEHEAASMLQDISIVMVGLKKRIGLERHLVVVLLYFLLLFLNRIFIVPL